MEILTLIFIIVILCIAAFIVYMILTGSNIFSLHSMTKPHKIVVFDLDETLGSFAEIGMFWDAVCSICGPGSKGEFFDMMDTFPEFVRPGVKRMLTLLADKLETGECDQVMIYTNNQGPRSWARSLADYFEDKAGCAIFSRIVAAFKVRGRVVEYNRTSHGKSVEDLIRCTKIPKSTEICFLDDQYHPLMEHDNVYYINVKPYHFSMTYKDMARRYHDKCDLNIPLVDFERDVVSFMSRYGHTVVDKSPEEQAVDVVVGKQIITHLNRFFADSPSKKRDTKKKRMKRARHDARTRKRRSKKKPSR